MAERRERARLPFEALAQLGISREGRRQDLDRDAATQPCVAGPVGPRPFRLRLSVRRVRTGLLLPIRNPARRASSVEFRGGVWRAEVEGDSFEEEG